ncbi:hypothetical protein Z052_12485 [Halorubrum sp. C191]|uniref:hypothetical protein n=1 Tax=Halorubrum sp. C191 TaxID=1383842 RepID=UPI000C0897C5|nr:hypothetical protein [Halorubrum sp. C191]PHQ41869.1 hypothetical protein Z052_12485 [Halorubrum sp. C191]
MEGLGPTARIVWKLARNHTWGQPIPEEDVIALATKDEDGDEMRAALDAALELSFLSVGPHAVYIPNGQTKHEEAADWLRESTGLRFVDVLMTASGCANQPLLTFFN